MPEHDDDEMGLFDHGEGNNLAINLAIALGLIALPILVILLFVW